MKVLQVNAVYRSGSTGRNIFELKKAMAEHGIESYIAATHMKEIPEGCYQIGAKPDWKIHGLLSRISGLQGYHSKRATAAFLKYLDNLRPDIVHLNNLHANYINLDMLFRYLISHQIPTVITLHDCWFYTGKCTHYTTQGCNRWKTGCFDCPKLNTDNVSWFFDKSTKMWNDKKAWFGQLQKLAVVGVSDWITNEARQSILGGAAFIKRIYNWIDLDIFREVNTETLRKKLGLEDKYVLLGIAGNWANKKGLDLFYKLSGQISPDETILLVGELPENLLPQGGLPTNIIHIPATESVQELASYYSMADVFLQLSEEETFGKVVAEALACGTPVITIDSTANGELVSQQCGIVLRDKNELLKAHKTIRENGRNFYSENCRKFAEDNFGMKDRTDDYIALYRELVKP